MRHAWAGLLALGGLLWQADASPAAASEIGLTESVYHGIPEYAGTPTGTTITQEQQYAASVTPAYTFTNTRDGFNYVGNVTGQTVSQFFGADAAGAALSDTSATQSFAFDAHGFIYAPTAGIYTFDLGNTFNNIDDAARVTVDGSVVAEQNFTAQLSPYNAQIDLTAGYHAFDLFYFQTAGGWNLGTNFSGPSASAIAFVTSSANPVPEPRDLTLMAVGLLALYRVTKRRPITGRSA